MAAVQIHATHSPEQVLIGGHGVGVVLGHGAVRGLGNLTGRRRQLPILGRLAGREAACGQVEWGGIGPLCHSCPSPNAGAAKAGVHGKPLASGVSGTGTRPPHSHTHLLLGSFVSESFIHLLLFFSSQKTHSSFNLFPCFIHSFIQSIKIKKKYFWSPSYLPRTILRAEATAVNRQHRQNSRLSGSCHVVQETGDKLVIKSELQSDKCSEEQF